MTTLEVKKTNKALMQRSVLRMMCSTMKEEPELVDRFEFLDALLPMPFDMVAEPETDDMRRSRILKSLEAIVE